MEKITVHRHGLFKDVVSQEIDADIYGCFAVHPNLTIGGYTLTHVQTGYAYLTGVTKEQAEAAAKEILAGKIDWTIIHAPSDLTPKHRKQGRDIRARYQ